MNVFVLNSGRCGSTTFIQACCHIVNFSAGHESRCKALGQDRLAYPTQHIEADNRLSWFLGRLDKVFGNKAWYVHLKREPSVTATSFVRRRNFGIMQAYREGILMGGLAGYSDVAIAEDYLETIDENIRCFLKDKSHQINVHLESASNDFERFWHWIGAEGDLDAALAEWQRCYNASEVGLGHKGDKV